VTADMKPAARKREPVLLPIGYITQQVRRRATRPLHNRRDEIRANAEAAFTMSNSDDVKAPKPVLSRWPSPNAIKVSHGAQSTNGKSSLTDLIVANPGVLDV
jgi:hypothetical protein